MPPSRLLARLAGDRPVSIPDGYANLGFTAQFCERLDDVVVTVEQSIGPVQADTYGMVGIKRETRRSTAKFESRLLHKAFSARHDLPSQGRRNWVVAQPADAAGNRSVQKRLSLNAQSKRGVKR